jgi:hypothetical protein
MTTPDLAGWFREAFGGELPLEAALRPAHHLGAKVWGSESLVGRDVEPPMTPGFLDEPAEYVLAGYWGHGVNSWAFYYVGRWSDHRVFFRLAFGGVYGDTARDAAFARDFLARYQELRVRDLPRLRGATLIHNMGDSAAQLEVAGGTVRVADQDDFWGAVARAAAGAAR